MTCVLNELIEGVRASRRHFLRHTYGMTAAQWVWKPYPECKNVRETCAHMMSNDLAALETLQCGTDPDYWALYCQLLEETQDCGTEELETRLVESQERILRYLVEQYGSEGADVEVFLWGKRVALAYAVPHLSSENYYHAGQVAFIRMATDPAWDYYRMVYSGE